MKLRTAVFLSGGGRTLQNLLDTDGLPIDVKLVLSSSAKAYGLVRAKEAGIPTGVANRKRFPSDEAYTSSSGRSPPPTRGACSTFTPR
jgi:phosphoribosylglycinamide formyltransferase 1